MRLMFEGGGHSRLELVGCGQVDCVVVQLIPCQCSSDEERVSVLLCFAKRVSKALAVVGC